ncbi:MAG: hypothetical protein DRJ32_01070 [Thermoprotei archaeon]|nr:MAG: hypothetical protein B6U94_03655 [Thermofilum sp. ex4484_79]RLE61516.1 MAG: hypothetical protein DRJ32_01070 [Thermoprotei archaeon]HDD63905.1 hypothetical protein [Thermoprotei archaeon]
MRTYFCIVAGEDSGCPEGAVSISDDLLKRMCLKIGDVIEIKGRHKTLLKIVKHGDSPGIYMNKETMNLLGIQAGTIVSIRKVKIRELKEITIEFDGDENISPLSMQALAYVRSMLTGVPVAIGSVVKLSGDFLLKIISAYPESGVVSSNTIVNLM